MRTTTIAKLSITSAAAGIGCAAYLWRRASKREVERLSAILGWQRGSSVADVGAGAGKLAIVAARRVGDGGQVYATEIEPKKVRKLRKKTSTRGLDNVAVVEAQGGRTGLPAGSCDAILMRGSYHHFTDPGAITADLYRAVRPGGVVAVVDFPPRRWLTLVAPVKDVPANRGGHGIPMNVLIEEMSTAGFEVKERISRWWLDLYCVVFRKPATA